MNDTLPDPQQAGGRTPPRPIMLLADAEIATTEIVRRLLVTAGYEPVVVTAETLIGRRPFSPLVISRLTQPRLGWLPDYLQRIGVRYIYFLDDNFFEIEARQDRHHASYFGREGTRNTLIRFLQQAHIVWVQSPPLAAYLKQHFPSCRVRLTNAGVDTALFDAARRQVAGASTSPAPDTLRVGYPTTPRHHLAALIAGIVRVAEARMGRRIQFEFVGWWPDDVATSPIVRTFPAIARYEDYVAFAASRRWDVGLAPLGDSMFENCKTNLKFREYAALGVTGVYSDVPLYRSCVEPDLTGLLCGNDPIAWVDALQRLLENATLRQRIQRQSEMMVLSQYSNVSVANAVAALIAELEPGS